MQPRRFNVEKHQHCSFWRYPGSKSLRIRAYQYRSCVRTSNRNVNLTPKMVLAAYAFGEGGVMPSTNSVGRVPRRPSTRRAIIVAQDPAVCRDGRVVTAEIDIPAELLAPGPAGYRVVVIDYDASNNVLYQAADPGDDPVPLVVSDDPEVLLSDPQQHAANAYAIVMLILSRFEFALGRRVAWGFEGHQLHVAPHAFAEANAFYAREHRALFFGYFQGASGARVFTSLAHDIIAHETAHALLDGLRKRYLEPSSADQAAFHEGFADVVALLSVFALQDVVAMLLSEDSGPLIASASLTEAALKDTVLFGLALQMGQELSAVRGKPLRRSAELTAGHNYMEDPEFQDEHRRGEILVAAMLRAFLRIWLNRIARLGEVSPGHKDRGLVVEEGARVADHLLTMAIRALDYAPPTDITFPDYLSALLTIDREVVPDDGRYRYREALVESFAAFGIGVSERSDADGAWPLWEREMTYSRSRFDSLVRDREEMFRFMWENRRELALDKKGYLEVQSVRACNRIGPDGFILRETVAEYIQILILQAGELPSVVGIEKPEDVPRWANVRLFGGGALIFDEYGRLKFHIANGIAGTAADRRRQATRLQALARAGLLSGDAPEARLAGLHRARALTGEEL